MQKPAQITRWSPPGFLGYSGKAMMLSPGKRHADTLFPLSVFHGSHLSPIIEESDRGGIDIDKTYLIFFALTGSAERSWAAAKDPGQCLCGAWSPDQAILQPGDGLTRGSGPTGLSAVDQMLPGWSACLPRRMHSRVEVTCMTPHTSSRTKTGRRLISNTMLRITRTSHSPMHTRVVTM